LARAGHASAGADAWQLQDGGPAVGDFTRGRFAPIAAFEARFPLIRHDPDGDALSRILGGGAATHLVTPIAQLILAPFQDDNPFFPDEDSRLTEFDDTSLFFLRRHTGYDGFEEGPRANIGLRYSRESAAGADFSAALGRVFRTEEIDSFAPGSGLNGRESDYVGAWTVDLDDVFTLSHRLRVGDDFEINRNEVYAGVSLRGLDLQASYVFLAQDAVTPQDRHEVVGEGRYALGRNWYVGTDMRRDLEAKDWVRVGGELGYVNECVDVSIYGGRDFTSIDGAPSSTFYGVRLRLWALGGEAEAGRVAGACAPRRR